MPAENDDGSQRSLRGRPGTEPSKEHRKILPNGKILRRNIRLRGRKSAD